jgi:alpha-D-ribose 1-methylphosphonate 5-triphosphate synthase subunit PhnH
MPKVKEVGFDRVHSTQQVYRTILETLSRPGSIHQLSENIESIETPSSISKAAVAIAVTLLDGEVGFAVEMDGQELLTDTIRRLTYSKAVDYTTADYLFLDGDVDSVVMESVEAKVKIGTLSSPELAATLFLRVKGCTSDRQGSASIGLKLKGPGIQETTVFYVEGFDPFWLEVRRRLNAEYPLGIDMVLYTDQGMIAALPRTTQVEGVDDLWHM